MTGARQATRPKERDADKPPPEAGDGAKDSWRLKTVWFRTTTGASIPTTLGALPQRFDVRAGVTITINGSRVVVEQTRSGRRQRIDLPSELCVLEYEAPE